NKAIIWHDETKGATFDTVPIPMDMQAEVNHWRANLVEAVAEFEDHLMEKFFEDPNSITVDELRSAIRKATIAMKITPLLCGSAFKNKGVQVMLDAVVQYLPSPMDVPSITGINPETDQEEERKPDAKDKFAALAFKIMTDPF